MKIYDNLKLSILFFGLGLLLISACHDHDDDMTGTGELEIEFDHLANGEVLELGKFYTNAFGEKMNFSTFNYYISNIELVRSDGSVYIIPRDESYFLIKENSGANTKIKLKNIPAGDYKEFRWIIGVDSLKSVSPASERTGVLDPAVEGSGMYWDLNSGYIFLKAEGTSPSAPLDTVTNTQRFRYHIGLFGGFNVPTMNNIKKVSLHDPHGDLAKVRQSSHHSPHLHINVEIMEIFKAPYQISVASTPSIMNSPLSAKIAENYTDMFVLDHIHD